jgi:hypothetical protein
MTSTTRTFGKDIRVGDVIVTWAGKRRVRTLTVRTDDFAKAVWPEGAVTAQFDMGDAMTIARNDWLDVAA